MDTFSKSPVPPGKLEEFFIDGQPGHDAVVAAARRNATFGASRVHKLADRYLLSLFNFGSSEKLVMDVALADLTEDEYHLYDPVREFHLGTPSNGSRLWRKADLQEGFSTEVGPFGADFLILTPGKAAPAGPVIKVVP